MRYKQIWQQEGCGTDAQTLKNIVREFKEQGVQGIESQQALTTYIKRLDANRMAAMYQMDKDAVLQMMIDCVGVKEAFEAALKFMGYMSPIDYAEACEKYEGRIGAAKAATDNTESRLFKALHREDNLLKEIEGLQYTILVLKAKLYDTYEAINKPTDKEQLKGDMQPCRTKTEKTPSGSLE